MAVGKKVWDEMVKAVADGILKNPEATMEKIFTVSKQIYGGILPERECEKLAVVGKKFAEAVELVKANYRPLEWISSDDFSGVILSVQNHKPGYYNTGFVIAAIHVVLPELEVAGKKVFAEWAAEEVNKRDFLDQTSVPVIAKRILEKKKIGVIPKNRFYFFCHAIESHMKNVRQEWFVNVKSKSLSPREEAEQKAVQAAQKEAKRQATLAKVLASKRVNLSNGKYAFTIEAVNDLLVMNSGVYGVLDEAVYQNFNGKVQMVTHVSIATTGTASATTKNPSTVTIAKKPLPNGMNSRWFTAVDGTMTILAKVLPSGYSREELVLFLRQHTSDGDYVATEIEGRWQIFLVMPKRATQKVKGSFRPATAEEKRSAKNSAAATPAVAAQ